MLARKRRTKSALPGTRRAYLSITQELLILAVVWPLLAACGTFEIGWEHTVTPDPMVIPASTTATAGIPGTPSTMRTVASWPATPVVPPTSAPATHSLPPPVIHYFEADPARVNPGDKVTLAWSVTGATQAIIEQMMPADILGPSLAVPVAGSVVVTIPEHQRYWHEFRLVVSNDAGQTAQRSLLVEICCPYEYFFEPPPPGDRTEEGCPYKPAAFLMAVEQRFEHGWMIWLERIPENSTPTGAQEGPSIYVLYDESENRLWQRYDDTWRLGEPESDPSIVVPYGFHQARRGIGKLWQTKSVRERLGWALEPEHEYPGAYQVAWRPYSLFGGIYLRMMDGSIVYLGVMGSWELVSAHSP